MRLARSLVSDPHRAEDLAQETTLVALESPPANAASMPPG
jgi:DNA-directed RNA polymerase specialized sigma24 family protein